MTYKAKLRKEAGDEDHRLVKAWKEQNEESLFSADQYCMYISNPKGVPQIC